MKRVLFIGTLLFLAVSLIGFAPNGDKYVIGGKVAGLVLKDLDGGTFNLEKILGEKDTKGVVFVFLSYKCPDSKACDDRYVDYAEKYGKKGIKFVGINSNMRTENKEDMKKWAADNKYNFPVLWDDDNIIADRFEAKTTPHAFFVDSDGYLTYKGSIDDNTKDPSKVKRTFLADVLDAYLAGDAIYIQQTKPFG